MKRRVVITGLGAIAPNGIGKEEFWKALVAGRSGIDRISSFDASDLPCQIAGEVKGFDPADYLSRKLIERLPKVAQFAVAVSKMAADDAQLEKIPSQKIGVAFGTNVPKEDIFDRDHPLFLKDGWKGMNRYLGESHTPHFSTIHIASELGAKGPIASFTSGCIAVSNAIGWGCDQIQSGVADAVVIAGSESLLHPFTFAMVSASRLLSTSSNDQPQKASKPFDKRRDGYVLSEGAGAIILEARNSAIDRGTDVYAELLGCAVGCEAADIRNFDVTGETAAETILAAINRASIHPSELDYICAMGLSTGYHDLAETNAIKLAFGERAYHIPISSIKSMIGHPDAATPALQTIASCLALRD
ncbi:MAG: beta-ketoacyl-[acyl-carrier-protein] synthase family protein, partial [Candidatus Poribacteria bacterium]|nr:beta-ketoacyl-[acyl-carrier-protein] synthase family protein [Candidatus Poribacteria bacterium]